MKKNILLGLIYLLIGILFFNFLSAFGVASSNTPIMLAPGEEGETSLRLQNMIGEGDINVEAMITFGADIANIIGSNKYNIKLGSKDTKIQIRIKIPPNAKAGSIYKIRISLKTITAGNATGVSFGTAIEQDIQVIADGKKQNPKEVTPAISLILIVVMTVISSVVIFLIKRNKIKTLNK